MSYRKIPARAEYSQGSFVKEKHFSLVTFFWGFGQKKVTRTL
jgi:hypothetical protein